MQGRRCRYCGRQWPIDRFARKYECKECSRARHREISRRPEVRERNRKRFHNPEGRARHLANMLRYSRRPEVREQRRQYSQRPEVKERIKQHRQKPEIKQRRQEYYRTPKVRKMRQAYYQNNKERFRERSQKYYHSPHGSAVIRQRNQSRRITKGGIAFAFTPVQWIYALNYFNGCCAVCECQLDGMFGDTKTHQDHWIPHSKNGGYISTNIVPLCQPCNLSKHATMPEIWLEYQYGKRKAAILLQRVEDYFEHVRLINDEE